MNSQWKEKLLSTVSQGKKWIFELERIPGNSWCLCDLPWWLSFLFKLPRRKRFPLFVLQTKGKQERSSWVSVESRNEMPSLSPSLSSCRRCSSWFLVIVVIPHYLLLCLVCVWSSHKQTRPESWRKLADWLGLTNTSAEEAREFVNERDNLN